MKYQVATLIILPLFVALPVNGFFLGRFRSWITGLGSSPVQVDQSTEYFVLPPDSFHPDFSVDESGFITAHPKVESATEPGAFVPGWDYATNVINEGPAPLNFQNKPVDGAGRPGGLRVGKVPQHISLDSPNGGRYRLNEPIPREFTPIARSTNNHPARENSRNSEIAADGAEVASDGAKVLSDSPKVIPAVAKVPSRGAGAHEVSLYNIAVLDENGTILYTEQVKL